MVERLKFVEEMHRAIGHALTRWQYVETGLYIISHCCLGAKHQLSSTVFFHIESARSKLSLADKLCRIELPKGAYQKNWLPLKKEIGRAVDMRNALAHFDLTFLAKATVEPGGPTRYPIALVPNSHGPNGEGTPVKGLYVEQVQRLAPWFHDLTDSLLDLVPNSIPDWQERARSLPPTTLHTLENRQTAGKTRARPRPVE